MREVIKFETEDGKAFDTEQEARNHEALKKIEGWYEDNRLYGNVAGSRVDFDDLLDWLRENKSVVRALLRLVVEGGLKMFLSTDILEFDGHLDRDGEMGIAVYHGGDVEYVRITKKDAEEIIEHLKKVFGI